MLPPASTRACAVAQLNLPTELFGRACSRPVQSSSICLSTCDATRGSEASRTDNPSQTDNRNSTRGGAEHYSNCKHLAMPAPRGNDVGFHPAGPNRPRDHSSGYGVRDASTRRQDRRMQDHECKITNASTQDINPESTKLTNRLSPRRIHDHRVPLRRPRTAGSKEPQVRLTFRALPGAPTGGVASPYSASQGADEPSRLLARGRSTSVDGARRPAMRGLTRTRASLNKDL